ncbi:hypothetical protein AC578_10992 [Lecanosticta acicola]|uniref:Transcription initiation factor TFIID subunit 4 n=1 Tax=Lecanosticta acicola TaxID=111012 RepID=A0AAI8YTR2_9PEZI|nr:hypothetical protein AC578_10992 [Lecanosticta acicola]
MSYSMSPPAQKPAPYSPYQAAGSPTNNQSPYAPPAKRPRLSPDAKSPNGASPYSNPPHGLPMQYGNPYAQQGVQSPYSPGSFAGSPQGSFNTPQPYQQQQQMPWNNYQTPPPTQQRPSHTSPPPANSSRDMPPPPRPNKDDRDEKAGIDDINDSLFMSGINLKDEENYLHNTYNNRHVNDSFATNQSTSFGSSTVGSNNNSFNMLTQGTSFGSQGQDGGRLQPRSQEDIENEQKSKREQAARARAEKEQHHLNNQFLLGNCVRNRMHKLATDNAVRVDVQGVYVRNPDPYETKVMVNRGGTEGVAAVETKPEAMIEAGVPYENILSLISLAAGERLRGLVDDAFGLARARRYGDHGCVVPPEFADIAEGQGKKSHETVVPESVTGTQWDKADDDGANGVNGEHPANSDKATPQPVETISFQGTLNARLRELAERDKQAEKERAKKREARKRNADSAAGDESTPAATTPAETPAVGPVEAAAPVKMSKKEMNKKNKEQQTAEAQSFTQSNRTAAMMAMGGKKSKYSWMSGGANNLPTNRFARPAGGSGTATPKAQPEPAAAVAGKDQEVKVPTWGDWREDGVDGKGIQLRDWVLVLERDGREKRALQQAVNKLS